MLKKFLGNPESILPVKGLGVDDDLSYEELQVEILTDKQRGLRNKEIATIKAGPHTCYNGNYNGKQRCKAEQIQKDCYELVPANVPVREKAEDSSMFFGLSIHFLVGPVHVRGCYTYLSSLLRRGFSATSEMLTTSVAFGFLNPDVTILVNANLIVNIKVNININVNIKLNVNINVNMNVNINVNVSVNMNVNVNVNVNISMNVNVNVKVNVNVNVNLNMNIIVNINLNVSVNNLNVSGNVNVNISVNTNMNVNVNVNIKVNINVNLNVNVNV
ncbi:uncharacterized protein [Solanum lycopersicum]